MKKFWVYVLCTLIAVPAAFLYGKVQEVRLPAGTIIYVELSEEVSSKHAHRGEIYKARVWKDIAVDGHTVIEKGSLATMKVSFVKKAKMLGKKGKIKLKAISTVAVDGKEITLTGGYHEKGKSKAALVTTLALLVAWPLLFLRGKNAVLQEGALIDVYTEQVEKIKIEVPDTTETEGVPTVSLKSLDEPYLEAVILMDELQSQKKPKFLPLSITAEGLNITESSKFTVTTVNDEEIKPMDVEITERDEENGKYKGLINFKEIFKHFRLGINRFHISFTNDDGKVYTSEVILNAQL
jgi:hypothetical protein